MSIYKQGHELAAESAGRIATSHRIGAEIVGRVKLLNEGGSHDFRALFGDLPSLVGRSGAELSALLTQAVADLSFDAEMATGAAQNEASLAAKEAPRHPDQA